MARSQTVREEDRGTIFSPEGSPKEVLDKAEAEGKRLTSDQRRAKKAADAYAHEKAEKRESLKYTKANGEDGFLHRNDNLCTDRQPQLITRLQQNPSDAIEVIQKNFQCLHCRVVELEK